jgi:hypothetical protein
MEPLKDLEKWIFIELAAAVFFGTWLLLLLRRRDLWLRFTAAEAAFWLRLRMPARLVAASRRWEEGRSFVHWIAGFFVVTLLVLVAAAVLDFHIGTNWRSVVSLTSHWRQRRLGSVTLHPIMVGVACGLTSGGRRQRLRRVRFLLVRHQLCVISQSS